LCSIQVAIATIFDRSAVLRGAVTLGESHAAKNASASCPMWKLDTARSPAAKLRGPFGGRRL